MKIGQLAQATGVAPRLLRYYEQQGLLSPARGENGYREYDGDAAGTVRRIRGLLEAGLGTDVIRRVLPCNRRDGTLDMCSALRQTLEQELADIDARVDLLAQHRRAIAVEIKSDEWR